MKRLVELTAEELRAAPVWRYESGTGAEALVEPAARDSLSQDDDEIFLAATDFTLADASRHFGFCFPADDSGIDYLQPVIVTPAGHVIFWFDGRPPPEALAAQWNALGTDPGRVFPVSFRCLVPVDGRTVTGRIDRIESSQDLASGPPAPHFEEPADAGPEAWPKEPGEPDRVPTARPTQARRDTGPVEKRTARRREAAMSVEFDQGSLRGTGVTRNLSPRGMFVSSERVPGSGPTLRLTVSLPEGRKLVLKGKVVRSARESGFGLRLAEESAEYQDLLARLRGKRKRKRK